MCGPRTPSHTMYRVSWCGSPAPPPRPCARPCARPRARRPERCPARPCVRLLVRASRASRATMCATMCASSCALSCATMCAPPAPHVCAQHRAFFSSFVSVIFLLSLFCLYSSLISSFPRLTPSFFRIFMEPSCVFLWCSTSTQRFLKIQPKQITLGDKKAIR